MARPIAENGRPYPRRRPLNWEATKGILRHRKAHRDILREGFTEVGHFGPWQFTQNRMVMVDSRVHPDGTRLYVKLVQPIISEGEEG